MAKQKRMAVRADIATRKQAFVRDEIEAAAAALFAERGYRAVTMDDVADSLGYTKSVIYYYFKNKNEILWQIFTKSLEFYSVAMKAIEAKKLPPNEALTEMIREHAKCVMQNKNYTTIYNREEAELEPQQRRQLNKMKRVYDSMFEEVFKAGVELQAFRDMPSHVAISGILGMCNWLHVWYDEKGSLTPDQIADHYAVLLRDGYATKADPAGG